MPITPTQRTSINTIRGRSTRFSTDDHVVDEALQVLDDRDQLGGKWDRIFIRAALFLAAILLAFAPFFHTKFVGWLNDSQIRWIRLLGSGEILLIAVALIADGIGKSVSCEGESVGE